MENKFYFTEEHFGSQIAREDVERAIKEVNTRYGSETNIYYGLGHDTFMGELADGQWMTENDTHDYEVERDKIYNQICKLL